ncbi:RNA polymerase subunit sigma-70 [Streptomyces sp. NPDC001617]
MRRTDPQHHHEHGERPEPQPGGHRAPQKAGSQSGRTVAQTAEQGRQRRSTSGHLDHARHAPNDTRFLVVTGELTKCRPIYGYVLFRTKGRPVTQPQEREQSTPLTPAQAFDALYAFCAPALVRQTYLLTGRRELARESVERAFQLAWQRWPEVAVDRDPAGWVRATAYDCALSPWHRFRPRYRRPEPPPADAPDRALLAALLGLPPPYRRTVVLYDGVGLGLPETAAETEASTPAAAGRLLHAREAIVARVPELADPAELHRRLAALASAERLRAARPPAVRVEGERRTRFWTRAAIACTVALIGTTAVAVRMAPTHYEPPVAPGGAVQGLPPRLVRGALSEAEAALRAKLHREAQHGPERLVPQLP